MMVLELVGKYTESIGGCGLNRATLIGIVYLWCGHWLDDIGLGYTSYWSLCINEASPLQVSLHTSCTGAQKHHRQNETMMVLSPLTLSFEQRYSLNRIQELNTTTYLDGLPDQFNLMFSFPEMGPKHVGR